MGAVAPKKVLKISRVPIMFKGYFEDTFYILFRPIRHSIKIDKEIFYKFPI